MYATRVGHFVQWRRGGGMHGAISSPPPKFKPVGKKFSCPKIFIPKLDRYTFCGRRYLSNCRTVPDATLASWGHMTSSVRWPFHSQYAVSYWWFITTIRLSCTVTEIWSLKYFGVTTLTFRGHVSSSVTWPLDSQHMVSY